MQVLVEVVEHRDVGVNVRKTLYFSVIFEPKLRKFERLVEPLEHKLKLLLFVEQCLVLLVGYNLLKFVKLLLVWRVIGPGCLDVLFLLSVELAVLFV